MEGTLEISSLLGWETAVYIPEGQREDFPVLFLNGGKGIGEDISSLVHLWERIYSRREASFPYLLAGLGAADWNSAYSPWPAESLAKGGEAFSGHAPETGKFLLQEYLPYICRMYPASIERDKRIVAGYSLGGLAALYLFLKTGQFAGAASCSGSLWYPGWCAYLENASFPPQPSYVYLSLGRAERKIRSRIMAQNPACTEKTCAILSERMAAGSRAVFQWNNGGHGFEVTERLMRAFLWMREFIG